MRSPILITLALILGAGTAQAKNDEVQKGPVPDWVVPSELSPVPENASGLAFARRRDTLVHFDDQGQLQYTGYRLKILHSNALQLGNFSVAWNPDSGAPVVHAINIYRDGEVIDVLRNAEFAILRREGQLEQASLDGVLTAALQISDLRVGDELEVAVTVRISDPIMGDNSAGFLVFVPNQTPGPIRMGMSWEEGQEPAIRANAEVGKYSHKQARSVDYRFEDRKVKPPVKDAPPRYLFSDTIQFSDYADWAAVSRNIAPPFAKAATLSDGSPVKREAARIAAAHESQFDRASAALKLVQQDVRYVYVGLNGGNLKPATAEETWQRRYGDCKGKTVLLLGLLAELGIKAEAVLASNSGLDDSLDSFLPNPGYFDHVLVRAWIDGKAYWMDGTLPPVARPGVDPYRTYRWVLPLSQQGAALEKIEWKPSKRPDSISLIEIDARDGFDTQTHMVLTEVVRGLPGLELQAQFSALTQDDLLNAFRQQLVGEQWSTVDDVQWRYDQDAAASVLTISGTSTTDWDDDGDGAKSLALPGGGFSSPDKRMRLAGEDQNIPYFNAPEYSCSVTTVRLPKESKPDNWYFESGFDSRIFGQNYYRAFDLRDNAIRMVRGFRVEQQEIDAATASKDNERISDFDNSRAWIYYDPAYEEGPDPSEVNIPATYDIDWLADDVPCLSPKTVR